MAIYYFFFGLILALITMRTNSLEVAFGAHMANNMFAAIIVNYEGSPLQTSPFFELVKINPGFELFMTVIGSAVLYGLATRKNNEPRSVEAAADA